VTKNKIWLVINKKLRILEMLYLYCVDVLYTCTHIYQTLMNSLHRLLNCEIGGLDRHVNITEYRTRVHCIHM